MEDRLSTLLLQSTLDSKATLSKIEQCPVTKLLVSDSNPRMEADTGRFVEFVLRAD